MSSRLVAATRAEEEGGERFRCICQKRQQTIRREKVTTDRNSLGASAAVAVSQLFCYAKLIKHRKMNRISSTLLMEELEGQEINEFLTRLRSWHHLSTIL